MNTINKFMFGAILLSSSALLSAQTTVAPAEPVAPVDAAAPMAEAEVAPVAAEAPLDRSTLKYSNKWRVKFDNEAKSDGNLVFRMVMKNSDAEPVVVTVPISKGTNENNTAGKVKNALQKAFPRDFNVEKDDGESVLVKLNVVEGSSSLVLLSNDVKNLKIKLKKE